jgi:peptidyl-prolyl cis-trans isomerase D
MLEKIRESAQGPWAMIVIGLIVLSFVFAGVGSYLTGSTQIAAALVNGEEISANSVERAYQNERARIEGQFGEGVAALFSNPDYLADFRMGVLDRLIGEKLIEQKAIELGLRVSDEQILKTIRNMPEFQVGGSFNNQRFQAIIQQAGFQPNSFRDYMRTEMTRDQFGRSIIGTEFSLENEVTATNALQSQLRDIQVVTVSASDFSADVSVDEGEIAEYYQTNIDNYDTEERVALSFVELKADDLMAETSVAEEELTDFYSLNQGNYLTEEERRVSHILVEFGDDKAVALQTANNILAKVERGDDFAALAKTDSADTFSAENGGDLDFFGRDIMDPNFEQSAFELASIGDTSEIVESEFGFHIIKLTDIKPEIVTPFDDVRDDIQLTVQRDKAMELFFAKQQNMAELAFEIPETLEDVAGDLGVSVQTTELFTQSRAPSTVNFPQVLAAGFSAELVEDLVNSDVIEISDEHVMVVRVREYEPQRTLALDEVEQAITSQLKAEKAQQAALDFADGLLLQLQDGNEITELLAERNLAWQKTEKLARFDSSIGTNVAQQVFTLGLNTGENITTVARVDGDVALVELLKVETPEGVEASELASLKQRLSSQMSQSNYAAFIATLRADADVVINVQ